MGFDSRDDMDKNGENAVAAHSVERVTTEREGESTELALEDLGYTPLYRRAFGTLASFCLTVAITSYASLSIHLDL